MPLPPLPQTPPPLPLPLLTAIFAAAPLSIAKERGSSSTTTSVPTAALMWKRLQVQTTWTNFKFYPQYWSVWCWSREFSD
jgi:hypothetical protein